MKKLTLILILFTSAYAFAQDDTSFDVKTPKTYFKEQDRAKWTKKTEKQDSLWLVKFYHKKNNNLQEVISFSNDDLDVKQGIYQLYDNNILIEEGNYVRGYKTGIWSKYFPNHDLKEKVAYVLGKMDGPIIAYWDNKQLKKEGTYKLGTKVSIWKMFLNDGQLILDENYDTNGQLIKSAYFDATGNKANFPVILTQPTFVGGLPNFYQTIMARMKYPVSAFQRNVQGKVKLNFSVLKNGDIGDIKIVETPDAELAQEAIRLLKTIKGWTAGQELGDPVVMRQTIGINFALGN